MLDYTYRATPCCAESFEEEATAALAIMRAAREERDEVTHIQVVDDGKHHGGLQLAVQVFDIGKQTENEAVKKWRKRNKTGNSFYDVCTLYLSKRQGEELIEAIKNAFSMRKYDDENVDDDEE